LLGPVGGLSQNFRCANINCRATFNDVGPFGFELLSGPVTVTRPRQVDVTIRVQPAPPRKRPIVTRLWRLEMVRRRIPYAYWLVYDAVVLWALLTGNPTVKAVAFLCLATAVFFDVVEFIIKGSENRWLRRLFEGTGPP